MPAIRITIEKAHLMRMGHILRISEDRIAKQAILRSNQDLENLHKSRKKQQTMVRYWRRLLKEAGVEVEWVEKLVMNRKDWKEMIKNRMKFLQSFDEKKERHMRRSQGKLISSRGAKKR